MSVEGVFVPHLFSVLDKSGDRLLSGREIPVHLRVSCATRRLSEDQFEWRLQVAVSRGVIDPVAVSVDEVKAANLLALSHQPGPPFLERLGDFGAGLVGVLAVALLCVFSPLLLTSFGKAGWDYMKLLAEVNLSQALYSPRADAEKQMQELRVSIDAQLSW